MVREFKLVNEKGQEYSLMNAEKYCFLAEPSGLGFARTIEYEQLGNAFIESISKIQQEPITGNVLFKSYDNYNALVNFIASSEKIKFAYKIPFQNGAKEYFKDIKIQSLSKTQKQINGLISETINIDCLSLWYQEKNIIFDMSSQEDEMRWNFKWDTSRFVEYNNRSLEYVNNGHVEAPVEIEINGPVTNPRLELYIEGELYQTVPITTKIAKYEKLLYGTKENKFYIEKVNTDGTVVDLFKEDIIDINNDNVIRFPKNKSCELRIMANEDITSAIIKIYEYYIAI